MAIRRSLLSDGSEQDNEDPLANPTNFPLPSTPFQSNSTQPEPTDVGTGDDVPIFNYQDRLPADVSLMSTPPRNQPGILQPHGIVAGGPSPNGGLPGSTPAPSSGGGFDTSFDYTSHAPAGYEASKWADPKHQTAKYVAGHIIAQGGTPQDVAAALGARYMGGDMIYREDLGLVDVVQDYGTSPQSKNLPFWNPTAQDAEGKIPFPQAPGSGGGGAGGSGGGYAPPGTGGVYGDANLQQVGQDPLSQGITAALMRLINDGGQTPFGSDIALTLKDQIGRASNPDNADLLRRFESARELEHKARRTMLNESRADLANRGLVSEPGAPSGAEFDSVQRIDEAIAPDFARNIRDIFSDESQRADARLGDLLTIASGMSRDQASAILASAGQGTQRQGVLADIALRSLHENAEWNKFIAQFGLDRDTALYQLQNGNSQQMMTILTLFLQFINSSRGGYVPQSGD